MQGCNNATVLQLTNDSGFQWQHYKKPAFLMPYLFWVTKSGTLSKKFKRITFEFCLLQGTRSEASNAEERYLFDNWWFSLYRRSHCWSTLDTSWQNLCKWTLILLQWLVLGDFLDFRNYFFIRIVVHLCLFRGITINHVECGGSVISSVTCIQNVAISNSTPATM